MSMDKFVSGTSPVSTMNYRQGRAEAILCNPLHPAMTQYLLNSVGEEKKSAYAI